MEYWIKALHVISVISWMAGLLYLPRLFVYHCDAPVGSQRSEMLKVMERRLMNAIMRPAMIATWVFGLWTAYLFNFWADPWFHAKMVLVVLLTVAHEKMAAWVRAFAADQNTRSQKFYRIANEVPTVLMIVIVILVIVKPF